MKTFDNKERRRYYGLRIGDLIEVIGFHGIPNKNAEVIQYGFGDNNRVYVEYEDGTQGREVAEYCKILTKVEDRKNFIAKEFKKGEIEL